MHHLSLYYFSFALFTLMQFPKLLDQMYSLHFKNDKNMFDVSFTNQITPSPIREKLWIMSKLLRVKLCLLFCFLLFTVATNTCKWCYNVREWGWSYLIIKENIANASFEFYFFWNNLPPYTKVCLFSLLIG